MNGFMGIENQCIQLVKVPYFKLPTIGKQLPTFPHRESIVIVRNFDEVYNEIILFSNYRKNEM